MIHFKKNVTKNLTKNVRRASTALVITCLLAACQHQDSTSAIDSMRGMNQDTTAHYALLANNSVKQSKARQAVFFFETLQRRRALTDDELIHYSQALRKTNQPEKALAIISPLAEGKMVSSSILSEYAYTLLANDEFEKALMISGHMLGRPDLADDHATALHLSGLAKDALQDFTGAEKDYRAALALQSKNTPASKDNAALLNNLGLNLAAQGLFEQSIRQLKQALAASENNSEISAEIMSNLKTVEKLRTHHDEKAAHQTDLSKSDVSKNDTPKNHSVKAK